MDFEDARQRGLNSASFDVSGNIQRQDGRRLGDRAYEVAQAMYSNPGMSFDEARLMAVQAEMARWNIDPSGMPRDPKAVTFGRRSTTSLSADLSGTSGAISTTCTQVVGEAEGTLEVQRNPRFARCRRAVGSGGGRLGSCTKASMCALGVFAAFIVMMFSISRLLQSSINLPGRLAQLPGENEDVGNG
eukprot:TRINITY_DN3639_c0_g1_i4.p2 TRINITY_DN3639_c0_g1~~TRINITY_DN3639_c0_g1_i4.p2  ORF type:complete len:188 (+),score=29.49 TRINITY_DN3639_c0_g1_i4:158-721(+)